MSAILQNMIGRIRRESCLHFFCKLTNITHLLICNKVEDQMEIYFNRAHKKYNLLVVWIFANWHFLATRIDEKKLFIPKFVRIIIFEININILPYYYFQDNPHIEIVYNFWILHHNSIWYNIHRMVPQLEVIHKHPYQ